MNHHLVSRQQLRRSKMDEETIAFSQVSKNKTFYLNILSNNKYFNSGKCFFNFRHSLKRIIRQKALNMSQILKVTEIGFVNTVKRIF